MTYTFNKRKVIKTLKEQGVEPDTIDFSSYSSDIPIEEWLSNEYGIVLKGLKDRYEDVKAQQLMAKEQELKRLQEEQQKMEERITEKQLDSVVKIPKLEILSNFIKAMVKSKDIHFLICSGSGGIGKSFTTISTLKAEKISYSMLKTKVTPLMLYGYLYEHRTETIVFDDLIGLLDSEISISILMSALWSVDGIRKVEYKSSSKAFENMGIPDSFEFSGKIILLTNNTNFKTKYYDALKDRGFYYELCFNYEEKIQFMKELIKLEHDVLSEEQRKEVLSEIIAKSTPATESFSFRTLLKAYSIRSGCDNWKEMIKSILPVDDALLYVYISVRDKVSQAWKGFVENGHGSRRKYYYLKKQLKI